MQRFSKPSIIHLPAFLLFLFLGCGTSMAQQNPAEFPVLSGPYVGQKPPSYIPQVFMPGTVSSNRMPKHSAMAFSPDGTEVYWSVANPFAMYYMKIENGIWTKPRIAPFTKGLECSSPVFTPDGKKLIFSSQKVEKHDDEKNRKFIISLWYVERLNDGWSEPVAFDSAINDGTIDYQVSFTRDGTIYFSKKREGPVENRDIFYARLVNGKYTTPQSPGDSINTDLNESRLYVAPDESYLIFTRAERVKRIMGMYMDFHISFRKADGSWTKAQEIGDMLGEKTTSSWINVSPDGKYLFFTSIYPGRLTNIYWTTSSGILDNMMPYECIVQGTVEQTIARFKDIQKTDPGNRAIQEDRLNIIGYNYLNKKKFTEAISVLKIITELYPGSSNAFDSLGEAYMKAGNKELAIENYEKSLKLKPESQSGIDALKVLKGKQ